MMKKDEEEYEKNNKNELIKKIDSYLIFVDITYTN